MFRSERWRAGGFRCEVLPWRGHTDRYLLSRTCLRRPWRVVTGQRGWGGGQNPQPRGPSQRFQAPKSRRGRLFVPPPSLGRLYRPPAPGPSLTPNHLLVSPGLCLLRGHRLRDPGRGRIAPPRVPRLTPPTSGPGPRPLPAPRPGSKAARVTWSPSSTESAGRAEGESGWKREIQPGSRRPVPAPAPGRAPAACAPRAAGSSPAHGRGLER